MNVLEKILEEIENLNYYPDGMGCGIEDRGITDRYEACEYGWNEAIEAVIEAINNIEEAESSCGNGGWIPVDERLPEEDERYKGRKVIDVLVTTAKGKVTKVQRQSHKGYWWWGRIYGEPTAWQPLPEPYKGGKE